ncbi:ATP-binding protein [Streptomyces sp. NPDC001255]|uniref:ATP-binding protein n=1 Tax=Streptomyces sp. NPDC001255 TaxID=3364550 RepID=UPI0036ADDB54
MKKKTKAASASAWTRGLWARPSAAAPLPVRRAPRDAHPLQLTDVVGHLTLTRSGEVTAWYVAAPVRWSFRSAQDCEALIAAHAARFAELRGRRVHLRITHRPYGVAQWASDLHAASVGPLPGWEEYLREEQLKVARLPLATKVVYYGVTVGKVTGLGRAAGRLRRGGPAAHLAGLDAEVREVGRIMGGPGMNAAPASAADMDWLMARSLGLGLPAPLSDRPQPTGFWEETDLPTWTDGIEWTSPAPLSPYLTVSGDRAGERVTRCVSVLALGRLDLPDLPQSGHAPWLQRLDRLPFPYELSATVRVRESAEATAEILRQLDAVSAQVTHHDEHGLHPPVQLDRQREEGRDIEDEIRSGSDGLTTRTEAWVRIAVSATTPEALRDRIALVQRLYGQHATIEHPRAQYHLAREFVPGEPLATTAYRRRLPVRTLGGSLPAVSASIGDRIGPNLGYTSGTSRRPVMWHPWHSQEVREGSGLTAILGTLGSGKSVLGGTIVYHTLRMGVPWIVMDPSGPLTRLCTVPELRPYSKAIDLLGAEPGTLNPYRLVPDPRSEHYPAEAYAGEEDPHRAARDAYERDVHAARGHRRTLALDVMLALLRPEIATTPQTHLVLSRAVQMADQSQHGSPREIIARLRAMQDSHHDHARDLAGLLEDAAQLPQGQLIFPAVDGDDGHLMRQWRLVVLSLRGLALPSAGSPPAEWSEEERLSVPMLYLASWYAQREIYARDLGSRKGLLLDEAHELQRVSSGRSLLRKTGRDSRKHSLRCLMLTQDGEDVLSAGVANWIDTLFVGRTVGADAQAAALRLLGVEPGAGYEQMLGTLSSSAAAGAVREQVPREFVMGDRGSGAIERITVSLSHRPELLAALDTTGNPRAAAAANPWTAATR